MPNGLHVDPNGNIIYASPFRKVGNLKGPGGVSISPKLGAKAFAHTVIINLTKDENLRPIHAKEYLKGQDIPNDGSGFQVIQTRQGSLSLSIPASLPIGVGIGVKVRGGMYHNAVRHVKTYMDIKKLPFISRIPSTFKDFQKYKIDDSLSFMTTGAISFSASMKIGMAGASSTYLAEGDWITTVTKTSPVHVRGTYKVSHIKLLSIGGGVSWTSLSLNKMNSLSDLLTYEFNLQNKAGLMAYQMFLKGDLLKAREIYLKSFGIDAFKGKKKYTAAVKIVKKEKSFSENNYSSKGISIPFLISAKHKSGRSFLLKNSRELRKGVIGTHYFGVFKEKSKTTGFLSRNAHRLIMFMGKLQETFQLEAGRKKILNYRFSGNYKYEYHRDKFDQIKLFEELSKLSHRIGFTQPLLEIIGKIPDKNLGFVQLQADLMISDKAIAGLMKMESKGKLKSLPGKGKIIVEKWFKKKNPFAIPLCSPDLENPCLLFLIKETNTGIKMIIEGIKKMNDVFTKKKGHIKQFVEAMSLMGEGFSKNRFTFKVFRRLLKHSGDHHLVVTWQGEKIPRGEKVLIQSKSTSYDGIEVKGDDKIHQKTKKIILNFLKKNRTK